MKLLLLMLTFSSLLASTAFARSDADICIDRWSSLIKIHNGALEEMKNGFDVVGTKPDTAFKFLNSAHSKFSTYQSDAMRIYLDCKDYTTLTQSQAEDVRDSFRRLERRSGCGLVLAPAVEQYHGVDKKVDEYNNVVRNYPDMVQQIGYSALVSVRQNQKTFNTLINYTSTCDAEGDIIDYAKQYPVILNDYEVFFKRFE